MGLLLFALLPLGVAVVGFPEASGLLILGSSVAAVFLVLLLGLSGNTRIEWGLLTCMLLVLLGTSAYFSGSAGLRYACSAGFLSVLLAPGFYICAFLLLRGPCSKSEVQASGAAGESVAPRSPE